MTEIDSEKFDSKKEARRFCELKLLEKAGEVKDLKRQVKFELIPAQKKDGKVIERAVSYIADFVYLHHNGKGWEAVVEDVKSEATRTAVYKLKRKLMLWRYNIRIQEV